MTELKALALEIDGIYEEASNNSCTCNVDENSCRYCGAWAGARRKVELALTRALSPSPDGEVMRIQEWLEGVATDDLDEIVADGGITAGMVIQQEAREFARRLARRDPLSSSPVKTEREGPMCRCSEEARVNRLAARMGAKFVKREEGGDA